MDDVRVRGPARARLGAGRLACYGFAVEAVIGHRPARYLLARRFGPDGALTVLFVTRPEPLTGTYIRIAEAGGGCEIETFIPTMRRPVAIRGRFVLDTLPLSDVGYLDLMAWPHPWLDECESPPDALPGPLAGGDAWTRTFRGPGEFGDRYVTEADDDGCVVERAVWMDAVLPVRRWRVVEESGPDRLPLRIEVARPRTGHSTEFVRTGEPRPLDPAVLDRPPGDLRAYLDDVLAASV
ncbi:hypothetical protein [Actinomadura rupiterrae]|uniref:hypothetical protein n=1 Tax=Actinomadura rupiterrae TaxID=559627 RepID=UPI0020A4FE37|nr:hypothetical protein [Actinomadura rupiterrae]MCP2335931.1 hypothetical protein [Actinomadura rupiterrae]